MNNILIVLGMHRSGTSLVANWLHECGLHLGDRLLEKGTGNEQGHFEDLDFIELHEQIFRFNKISYGGLMPPLDITLNNYYESKIRLLVDLKNQLRQQWGWKEPRTCLFVDYYKNLIPSAKYLILYRDYSFVVDSLIRREHKKLENRYKKLSVLSKIKNYKKHKLKLQAVKDKKDDLLKGWIIYNEKLLKLMEELPRNKYIFTDNQTLLSKSSLILDRITQWGFKLRQVDYKDIYDAKLMKEREPDLVFDKLLEEEAKALKNSLMEFKTM